MTLYDRTGVSLTLNASAETLVGNPHNFHDKTHSIRIVSGTWKLYTDEYYRGREITYTSTTPTLPAEFIRNIKSVQLVFPEIRSVQPFMQPYIGQIILYDDTNFTGDSRTLYASAETLVGLPYKFNDKTHSIRVVCGTWKLWTNTHYKGYHVVCAGPGAVSSMPERFAGTVSSVELLNSTVVNGFYFKSVL
jgi:hypothetical protein